MTALLPELASQQIGEVTSDPSAGTPVTFDFAGNFSADVNFNPAVVGFVENYFQVDLPTAWTITDQPFTGRFTPPRNPAEYADGDLNLDLPLLADTLGINLEDSFIDVLWSAGIPVPSEVAEGFNSLGITDVNSAVKFADKLLDFDLEGSGTLTNGGGTTGFDIGYSDGTNSIVIDGFDPNIVADSLTGQSTIAVEGKFGVNLVLSEFVQLTNTLGIDLPPNVDSFLATAQFWGINQIGLASGSFNFGVSTVPVSTVL